MKFEERAVARNLGRFEGRLFSEDGCLFMVVHADEGAGIARVTARVGAHTQVIEMPFADMVRRVTSGSSLVLDNLNGPDFVRRLQKKKDGWHFTTREGLMGPFESEGFAARQLTRYILRMQTEPNPTPAVAAAAPPRRADKRTPARRSADRPQSVTTL
jgi:hypothetical protein